MVFALHSLRMMWFLLNPYFGGPFPNGPSNGGMDFNQYQQGQGNPFQQNQQNRYYGNPNNSSGQQSQPRSSRNFQTQAPANDSSYSDAEIIRQTGRRNCNFPIDDRKNWLSRSLMQASLRTFPKALFSYHSLLLSQVWRQKEHILLAIRYPYNHAHKNSIIYPKATWIYRNVLSQNHFWLFLKIWEFPRPSLEILKTMNWNLTDWSWG